MPRKNRIVKHTPFQSTHHEASKTRYTTKLQAEQAAERQVLLNPGLELYVYKSNRGGWYLTRRLHPFAPDEKHGKI